MSVDNELALAGIVAVSSAVAPLLVTIVTSYTRRRERAQDYERQDAVAAQVKKAAESLVQSNAVVAATAEVTNKKLDVIHILVNSNMTAAMQAELDATVREIAMMREVIALNRSAGREPHEEAVAAVEATEHKINELRANLSDRLTQAQAVAEVQKKGGGDR